jgi:hypothetical protein
MPLPCACGVRWASGGGGVGSGRGSEVGGGVAAGGEPQT